MVQSMQKEFTELEKEKKDLQEEIRKSHEARRAFLMKSIQTDDDKDREGFLDSLFVPSVAVVVSLVGGPLAGVAIAAGGWAANYLRREQTSSQAVRASEHEENTIQSLKTEKEKKTERMLLLREDGLKRIAMMRKLAINKAHLGDVKNLEAASAELGKVGQHLAKIALFWEDFAVKIEELVKSQDPAKLMLKHIEQPKVAERFYQRLDTASQYWSSFGGVCVQYVKTNTNEIEHLYKFLSAPIHLMSIKDCEERKKELLEKMEEQMKALPF